jgi:hypothetical protein
VQKSAHLINETFANEPLKPLKLESVTDPGWEEYLGILVNFSNEAKP